MKRLKLKLFITCLFCIWGLWSTGQVKGLKIYPEVCVYGKETTFYLLGSGMRFNRYSAKNSLKCTSLNSTISYYPGGITYISDTLLSFKQTFPYSSAIGPYAVFFTDSAGRNFQAAFTMDSIHPTYLPGFELSQDNIRIDQTHFPVYLTGVGTFFNFPFGKLKIWLQMGSSVINATIGPNVSLNKAVAYFDIPPSTTPGRYDLNVKDSLDSIMTWHEAIELYNGPVPTLVKVLPDTGRIGQKIYINIAANDCHFLYHPGNNFYLVKGNDTISMINGDPIDDNSFEVACQIPYAAADTGYYTVVANNMVDGQISSQIKFHILSAIDKRIYQVSPDSSYPGSNFVMTALALNTKFTSGSAKLWLSQGALNIFPQSTTVVTDERITAYFKIPSNVLISSGKWNVNTEDNEDGVLTLPDVFQIPYPKGPALVSINPDTLIRGNATTLDIKSLNTHFSATSRFYIKDPLDSPCYATVDKIVSPTEVIAHITPGIIFDQRPVYLYYADTNLNVRLDNPLYIIYNSGIEPEARNTVNLTAYPNPFHNTITLTYNLPQTSEISIQVFDMMCRQVWHENQDRQTAGKHETEIRFDNNENKAGMYMVRMQVGDAETWIKVVKGE